MRRLSALLLAAGLLVVSSCGSPSSDRVVTVPPRPPQTHKSEVDLMLSIAHREQTRRIIEYVTLGLVLNYVGAVGRAEVEASRQRRNTNAPTHGRAGQRSSTSAPSSSGQVNGHPCGGDLPACYILARESHGTNAENPRSSASGYWQFLDSTWNGYGGYRHASDAPADVQDAKAREVWAGGAGASHWACC